MDHSEVRDGGRPSEVLRNFLSRRELFVDVLILLTLGLLSITWFRGDHLILGGDFGLPLDRLKYLKLTLFSWDNTVSMGLPTQRQLAGFLPLAIYGAITEVLGLSIVASEKILFYLWFVSCGLSMYYLSSVLKLDRLGRLSSSLFYMFNPFSMIVIWHVFHGMIIFPYAFAPLILGMYINGIENQRGLIYVLKISVIWLLLVTSSYLWPVAAFLHWFPLFLYLIYYVTVKCHGNRESIKRATVFSTQLFFTWFFLNLFWILPFFSSLSEQFSGAHSSVFISDIKNIELTSVPILGALRLFGYWSFFGEYPLGDPFYSYSHVYTSSLFIVISFLIPAIAFLPLLSRRYKTEKNYMFFVFFTLLSIFLIKGTYPPFKSLSLAFYEKSPYIALAFRTIYIDFGILLTLAYSPLIGTGMSAIKEYFSVKIGKNKSLVIQLFLCFLLFFVLVYPLWTGDVIHPGEKLFPSGRVTIPDSYDETAKWLSQEDEYFRIFSLPMSQTYNVAYAWESGYTGGDIMRWFSSKPIINANTGATYEVPLLLGKVIDSSGCNEYTGKLFGLLEAKYVLFHRDTKWAFIEGHSWWFNHNPEKVEACINPRNGFILEQSFGELDFYRNEYFEPMHFYTPQRAIYVEGGIEALIPLSHLEMMGRDSVVFLSDQNPVMPTSFNRFAIYRDGNSSSIREIQSPSISSSLFIQKEENYETYVTYNIPISHTNNYDIYVSLPRNETIFLYRVDSGDWVKGTGISLGDSGDSMLLRVGKFELSEGKHNISFKNDKNLRKVPKIDYVFLYSRETIPSQDGDVILSYEEINPTRYRVHVNASRPFFLVFSEAYNPKWEARLSGSDSPIENHLFANGYANSWYIEKTGEYSIFLEFTPQKIYNLGVYTSVVTLLLCLAGIIYLREKN